MAQIGHFCYRLNYTTQHEIDWKSGILLQANASFTQDQRDTELAQEEVFRLWAGGHSTTGRIAFRSNETRWMRNYF